jgi:hypothetical protein
VHPTRPFAFDGALEASDISHQHVDIMRTGTYLTSDGNHALSPAAVGGVTGWKEGRVVCDSGTRAENDSPRRRPQKLACLGCADVAAAIVEFVSVGYSRRQREQLNRDLSGSCMRYLVNGRALLARWQEPGTLAQMILLDRYQRLGIPGDGVLWATAEFVWLAREAEKMNVVGGHCDM